MSGPATEREFAATNWLMQLLQRVPIAVRTPKINVPQQILTPASRDAASHVRSVPNASIQSAFGCARNAMGTNQPPEKE